MAKEFIPYEQALALKELGFNEPCLAQYRKYDVGEATLDIGFSKNEIISKFDNLVLFCSTPLYQQAFRWFREKYNLQVYIDFYHKDSYFYKIKSQVGKEISNTTGDVILQGTPVFPRSYEETELECLKKLIEIVKEKK